MSYSLSRRCLIGILAAGALSGCGFRLRGSFTAPFETLYVRSIDDNTPFYGTLRRTLESGSNIKLVSSEDEADAVLDISRLQKSRDILTINVSGKVREYELTLQLVFSVVGPDGFEYVPETTLTSSRDLSYSESEFLSRENEEALLYEDMQNDLLAQLTRYIEASRLPQKEL